MKLKRTIKPTNEISMASISDIAFLLIIFFMVSSSFIVKEGLHLVLPSKDKKPVVIKDREFSEISIKKDGRIYYNNRVSSRKYIEKKLKDLIEKENDRIVLVKFYKDTPYQKTVDVIDMAKYAGVKKLSLKMLDK